jgi:hypothetical protein
LTEVGEIILPLWLGQEMEQPEKAILLMERTGASMPPMFPWRSLAWVALLFFSGFAATPVGAAEAPYFEDFDTSPPSGVPANFVETPGSNWILNPGVYQGFAGVPAGGSSLASSSISLTNVAGHDFTVKVRFAVGSSGAMPFRKANVGLVILADNPDVTTGGYVLWWESAGLDDVHNKLFLERTTGPVLFNVADTTIAAPRGERLFTMTLHGVYVNGALRLTGTLSNGPKMISAEITDPTPLTGTYFGFRLSASVSMPHSSSISATYDVFSATLDSSP